MKNKLLKKGILVIVAVLLMMPNCVAFAGTTDLPEKAPDAKSSFYLNFVKISSTKEKATVNYSESDSATSITSTITLQSAPLNSNSYTAVSGVSPKSKIVYNTASIYHECDFNVSSSKEYRIKSEVTVNMNGIHKTSVRYCEL